MHGVDAPGMAPHQGERIGATAHQPGEVDLPEERRRSRGIEEERQGVLAVGAYLQLPVMVVVAEVDALARAPFGHGSELMAERAPERRRRCALPARHGGHVELGEAQHLASLDDRLEALAQRRERDMCRGHGKACAGQCLASGRRFVDMRADQLDMPVARFSHGGELALEAAELAQAVELHGDGIVHRPMLADLCAIL
jgi:hypothetical protein